MKKRFIVAVITGAILGIFCILGANMRFGGELSTAYLFGFWFNRLLMGVVFGLLPVCTSNVKRSIRGIVVGLFVSFAFFSATEFLDLMGFFAGAVYGLIIEWVMYLFTRSSNEATRKQTI